MSKNRITRICTALLLSITILGTVLLPAFTILTKAQIDNEAHKVIVTAPDKTRLQNWKVSGTVKDGKTYYSFINSAYETALDASEDGLSLKEADNGSESQLWLPEKTEDVLPVYGVDVKPASATEFKLTKVEKEGNVYYQIIDKATGRALINNNLKVGLSAADADSDAQLWTIEVDTGWRQAFRFINRQDGKQLWFDNTNSSLYLGEPEKKTGCAPTDLGYFHLKKYCMKGSTNTLTNVYYDTTDENQAWRNITGFDGQEIRIAPLYGYEAKGIVNSTGLVDEYVEIDASVQGVNVSPSGEPDIWKITKALTADGTDYYHLTDTATGLALVSSGASVGMCPADDSDAQLWTIEVDTGWRQAFRFINKQNGKQLRFYDKNSSIYLGEPEKITGSSPTDLSYFHLKKYCMKGSTNTLTNVYYDTTDENQAWRNITGFDGQEVSIAPLYGYEAKGTLNASGTLISDLNVTKGIAGVYTLKNLKTNKYLAYIDEKAVLTADTGSSDKWIIGGTDGLKSGSTVNVSLKTDKALMLSAEFIAANATAKEDKEYKVQSSLNADTDASKWILSEDTIVHNSTQKTVYMLKNADTNLFLAVKWDGNKTNYFVTDTVYGDNILYFEIEKYGENGYEIRPYSSAAGVFQRNLVWAGGTGKVEGTSLALAANKSNVNFVWYFNDDVNVAPKDGLAASIRFANDRNAGGGYLSVYTVPEDYSKLMVKPNDNSFLQKWSLDEVESAGETYYRLNSTPYATKVIEENNSLLSINESDLTNENQLWKVEKIATDENKNTTGRPVYEIVGKPWTSAPDTWKIVKINKDGADYYQFVNEQSGYALVNLNGQPGATNSDKTADAQLWTIKNSAWSQGYYIINKADGRQLRAINNGTEITLGFVNTETIEDKNANVFYFNTSEGNISVTEFANLKVSLGMPTYNKWFYISGAEIESGKTYFAFKNKISNKYLTVRDDVVTVSDTYENGLWTLGEGAGIIPGKTMSITLHDNPGKTLTSVWLEQDAFVNIPDTNAYKLQSSDKAGEDASKWILHKDIYNGKTVYLMQNKDTGFFLACDAGKNNGAPYITGTRYGNKALYFEIEKVFTDDANRMGYEIRPIGHNATKKIVWENGTGSNNGTKLKLANAGVNPETFIWLFNKGADSPEDGLTATVLFRNNINSGGGYLSVYTDPSTKGDIFAEKKTGIRLQKWIVFSTDVDGVTYYGFKNNAYDKKAIAVEGSALKLTAASETSDAQLFAPTEEIVDGKRYYSLKNKLTNKYIVYSGNSIIVSDEYSQTNGIWAFNDAETISDEFNGFISLKGDQNNVIATYKTEAKASDNPADYSKYRMVSASSFKHDSMRWILHEDIYNGKTVYSIENLNTGYFITSDPSLLGSKDENGNYPEGKYPAGNYLASEAYGDIHQYFELKLMNEDTKEYEIRPLAWGGGTSHVLVWPGHSGAPYGKYVGNGTQNSGYTWLLNDGVSVPEDGLVVTLYMSNAWLRVTGDDEDYGIVREDDRIIYVSNNGDDANDGLSRETPIKTIERANKLVNEISLTAGNKVLFRKGDTFVGEFIVNGKNGSADKNIVIGSYGDGDKRPVIKAPTVTTGTKSDDVKAMIDQLIAKSGKAPEDYDDRIEPPENTRIYSSIRITNCNYIILEDIDCYSDNDAVTWYSHADKESAVVWIRDTYWVTVRNMNIKGEAKTLNKSPDADRLYTVLYDEYHDMYWYPYMGNQYGGLYITNSFNKGATGFENIIVDNVTASGIKQCAIDGTNFSVRNSKVYDSPAWGFCFTGSKGEVVDCEADNTGYGRNQQGSAAFLVMNSTDIVCSGLKATNIYGGDTGYDGVGFDFEGGNKYISLKDSYFDNIEGPAILVFSKRGNTVGNDNFVIDNCIIKNYCLRGANGTEGGINFGNFMKSGYINKGSVINTKFYKSGKAPFFTNYYYPSEDPNEVCDTIFFNGCTFYSEKTDLSKLKELTEQAKALKTSDITDSEFGRLQTVIDSAEVLLSNEYADKDRVEAVIKALINAIEEFKRDVLANKNSNDGFKVEDIPDTNPDNAEFDLEYFVNCNNKLNTCQNKV